MSGLGPAGDPDRFMVASSSTTIDLTDGVDEGERAKLQALGIDADALASGAETMRAALGVAATSTGGLAGTGGADLADTLQRLASMHAAGTLTDAEFAAAKARLLGG